MHGTWLIKLVELFILHCIATGLISVSLWNRIILLSSARGKIRISFYQTSNAKLCDDFQKFILKRVWYNGGICDKGDAFDLRISIFEQDNNELNKHILMKCCKMGRLQSTVYSAVLRIKFS